MNRQYRPCTASTPCTSRQISGTDRRATWKVTPSSRHMPPHAATVEPPQPEPEHDDHGNTDGDERGGTYGGDRECPHAGDRGCAHGYDRGRPAFAIAPSRLALPVRHESQFVLLTYT